jgi:hypothetical protein
MEPQKVTTESLIDQAGDIFDTYCKLTVVNATDKVTRAATSGMSVMVVGAAALVILMFMGLGFAWWIGEYMNNMKAGFFIIGGAYFLLLLIFLLIRKELVFPIIRNNIIRKVYE